MADAAADQTPSEDARLQTGDEASERRHIFIILLLAAVLLPVALGTSTVIFNDGDVSWHIATGRWIIEHGRIPAADPFSFTAAGKPWVPIEWLAELVLAISYDLAGYGGLSALVMLALVLLNLVVFVHGARFLRPVAIVAIIGAMDVILKPMMFARPHLLAWPLLALWTMLMLNARDRERAPPLAAALLMLVWVNFHGSFVMGLAIAGAFGLEALIQSSDRSRVARQWGLFGLACLAAALLNPNGLEGLIHPFFIANLELLPLIDEWKPSSLELTPYFFGVLAVMLLAVWRFGVRLSLVRTALLLGLLGMALLQVRHQAVLAIVAAMVLPRAFAASRPDRRPAQTPSALGSGAWAALAFIVVAMLAIRLIAPVVPTENDANPRGLIAAVPAELRSQPVLNGYSMGGPLILAGIRPYVDGRADMYGDELVVDYKRIVDGDAAALARAIERWDIRWTMIPHRHDRLVALLDASPDWRRLYSDKVGVIHVRAGARGGAVSASTPP